MQNDNSEREYEVEKNWPGIKPETTMGDIIRCFRIANKMGTKQLAVHLGVTHTRISLWESAKTGITKENLEKIATFFHVTANDMYSLERMANKYEWEFQQVLMEAIRIYLSYQKPKEVQLGTTTEYKIETNGNILRAIRLFNNMSVKEFSEKTGIAYRTIQAGELGNRGHSLTTMKKVAEATEIDVNEVLQLQVEANKQEWTLKRCMLEVSWCWYRRHLD